jgi:7,8-dihydropterin-6-yl-methyl-4-(beta-D-ribofuranosyl)aminobenzene 5'-phosphate synthase
MKITTLVDNESTRPELLVEHGLSLYIETKAHKILFDLGQGTLFLENAQRMAIDISEVDTVIVSHGHYDHGGGLSAFFELNSKARIYLSKTAFEAHYSLQSNGDLKYIGLNRELQNNKRIFTIDQDTQLDDELKLYTHLGSVELGPSGNKSLYRLHENELLPDDFRHEIHLVITEENQSVLFSGCAHGGILAILDQVSQLNERSIKAVVSGFHLHSHSSHKDEDPQVIQAMAETMMKRPTHFYTCHCTGKHPYMAMKLIMGAQLDYMAVGSQIEIK